MFAQKGRMMNHKSKHYFIIRCSLFLVRYSTADEHRISNTDQGMMKDVVLTGVVKKSNLMFAQKGWKNES
jgi:hypothetical protein